MNAIKRLITNTIPESALMHLQAIDHYFFGEAEVRMLSQLCTPAREAIDAGANIGTNTYFLRKYSRKVHSYEPNPDLASRLKRLLPDVNVRNVALSDKDGKVVLQIPLSKDGDQRHELASIAQSFDGPVIDYQVDAITIDSESFDNIGFIKIDVEQHERQVLQGAMNTVRRCRPVVMSEVSPLKYEADLASAFDFILREDYVGWFRFGSDWHPFKDLDPTIHLDRKNFGVKDSFIGGNVFFLPADHPRASTGLH